MSKISRTKSRLCYFQIYGLIQHVKPVSAIVSVPSDGLRVATKAQLFIRFYRLAQNTIFTYPFQAQFLLNRTCELPNGSDGRRTRPLHESVSHVCWLFEAQKLGQRVQAGSLLASLSSVT